MTSEMTAMKKNMSCGILETTADSAVKATLRDLLTYFKYTMDFLVGTWDSTYCLLTHYITYSSEKSMKEMNKKIICKWKKK